MNAHVRRIASALATAALVAALFVWCPLRLIAPIVIALSALVQLEFYQLVRSYAPAPRFGILLGTLYLTLVAALPGLDNCDLVATYALLAFAPLVFLFATAVMLRASCERPVATIAATLFGFFYVPFLLGFFLRIAQGETEDVQGFFAVPETRIGLYTLLAVIAITKLSDMGGFAFGLAFGRHKMCPRVSPKKSWEGFAGSVLGSSLASVGFLALARRGEWGLVYPFWDRLTVAGAVALGCAVATLGTLGDLIESRFKRECGVKDSGTFMPAGLGGFLDMFDSILFMPALFYPLLIWFAS